MVMGVPMVVTRHPTVVVTRVRRHNPDERWALGAIRRGRHAHRRERRAFALLTGRLVPIRQEGVGAGHVLHAHIPLAQNDEHDGNEDQGANPHDGNSAVSGPRSAMMLFELPEVAGEGAFATSDDAFMASWTPLMAHTVLRLVL